MLTAFEAMDMPAAEVPVAPTVAVPAPTVAEKPARLTTLQWLVFVWVAGAAAFVLFAVVKALRTNRWLRRDRKPLPAELQSGIKNLFPDVSGIKVLPKVWLVNGIGQPFVWGLLRGSIYLPTDFVKIDSAEHRRGILGHEISHILRFDAAVNILQIIAQAVFWFHPFVWWANKKNRAEREKCCDEMAIARLGAKAKDYSSAIVETLIVEHESTRPVPSLAVAGPVKNIEERIKTMMKPGKKFYKRPSLVTATVVLLLALLTVPTALVLTTRAGTQTETTGPARGEAVALSRAPATRHAQQTGLVVREVKIKQGGYGLSLSRDGNRLVYPKRKDGKTNLVVRNLVSGEETQITNYETGVARFPVFSPDGKKVAYSFWPDRSNIKLRVHIVSLETGEDRDLDQDGFPKDWSRDGRFILILPNLWSEDEEKILTVLPVGGGSVKKLKGSGGWGSARFSPDGKYVSYVSRQDQEANICLYPVDGGDPIQITHGSTRSGQPIWSPDGKMLLFLSQRVFGPDKDICGVSIVDGKAAGNIEIIKHDLGGSASLLISLSETGRLLYRRRHTGTYIYSVAVDPQTGQPTGEPVKLAAGYVPMSSPDGKRIAYISGKVLHVMSADGSNDQEIIRVHPFIGTHTWAPDNDHIYVAEHSVPETGAGIYSISVSTKERQPVFLDSDMIGHVTCSSDGKRLAFLKLPASSSKKQRPIKSGEIFTVNVDGTRSSKKHEIFTVNVDGTNLRQLTFDDNAQVYYPAWSPDGKYIAFVSGPPRGIKTLTVASVDDGTTREVFRGETPKDRFWEASWSPDGSKIAWTTSGEIRIGQVSDGKYRTFKVSLETSPKPRLSMPHWSADGTKMLFSTSASVQHLMLMDNFLPAAVASAKTQ
jgi:Tol biopolymer transport system component/beta-lactamase regulating signal transducer with metallopeptidase domain